MLWSSIKWSFLVPVVIWWACTHLGCSRGSVLVWCPFPAFPPGMVYLWPPYQALTWEKTSLTIGPSASGVPPSFGLQPPALCISPRARTGLAGGNLWGSLMGRALPSTPGAPTLSSFCWSFNSHTCSLGPLSLPSAPLGLTVPPLPLWLGWGVAPFSFISIFKNLSSWKCFPRVKWGSCWFTVRLETYSNCGLGADLGQALGKVEAGGWKIGRVSLSNRLAAVPPGAGTDGAAGTCSGKQEPGRHHRARSGRSNQAWPLEKLLGLLILK